MAEILKKPSKGVIVFSLGTVSNTTNMPAQMIVRVWYDALKSLLKSFVGAFEKLSQYTILWRMEKGVPNVEKLPHVHLLKWLPQKEIMSEASLIFIHFQNFPKQS